MSTGIDSGNNYEVEVLESEENVAYGTVGRSKTASKEDGSVSATKSSQFTKTEKILILTISIQSLLLLIAIVTVTLSYSKCMEVNKSALNLPRVHAAKTACHCNISVLENSLDNLGTETRKKLQEFSKYKASVTKNIFDLNNFQEALTEELKLLRSGTSKLIGNVNNFTRVINSQLEIFKEEHVHHVTNLTYSSDIQIKTFKMQVMDYIQTYHVFDSCEELMNLSIPFSPGVYRIRSFNCSSIAKYCSNITVFSCNGVLGHWKRLAYLNTNEDNSSHCPDGFEIRNDTYNPLLCRRTNTNAGCSSVIYPSNGVSYSQVCGTVRVHSAGTPDGFGNFYIRKEPTLNQVYVDGLGIMFGDSPNRKHIWTYAFATLLGIADRNRCYICDNDKESYVGIHYTCVTEHCSSFSSCSHDTPWHGLPCVGNETFYRQLSESTTDNIEMRVCRDQGRRDEDILFSFVEIFVSQ